MRPIVLGLCLPLLLSAQNARFLTKSKWLNGARSVVSHTIDDSTKFVPQSIDAMDRYGIKATIFVNTSGNTIPALWPRLQQAIDLGHEIGSHSRTHQCKWPDDENFCSSAYSDSEISGSRQDILKQTNQSYVWSWCYPCGNCANHEFIQQRLKKAGYLVARNYPDEAKDGHIMPDTNDYAANPWNASYTQVVQKKGGIALSGNTDVAKLNAKFDAVHQAGGIYNFMTHPQWADYGPESFYELHMKYLSARKDVWYVPMGPLYAYRELREKTVVRPAGRNKFAVTAAVDPTIYNGSVTLEFETGKRPYIGSQPLTESAAPADRWNTQYFRRDGSRVYVTMRPNATLEFK